MDCVGNRRLLVSLRGQECSTQEAISSHIHYWFWRAFRSLRILPNGRCKSFGIHDSWSCIDLVLESSHDQSLFSLRAHRSQRDMVHTSGILREVWCPTRVVPTNRIRQVVFCAALAPARKSARVQILHSAVDSCKKRSERLVSDSRTVLICADAI